MKREDFKNKYSKEIYLGDGLYATFDGCHIILRAPREESDHYVGLEPPVFENLLKYRTALYRDKDLIED